jgi:hypothetical protein
MLTIWQTKYQIPLAIGEKLDVFEGGNSRRKDGSNARLPKLWV